MNNKVGLKDMFEHKEALTLLARSMQPNLQNVMQEAVKLMAAICIGKCYNPIRRCLGNYFNLDLFQFLPTDMLAL